MCYFPATYEDKKFQHGAFLCQHWHLTELSKVFQLGCFAVAQVKASVELCINKLSDAAVKSELKSNCEKYELGNLQRRRIWLTRVYQVSWRFGRALKDWQIDHPQTQQGRQE